VFRNVGIENSDVWEAPENKNITEVYTFYTVFNKISNPQDDRYQNFCALRYVAYIFGKIM